MNYTVKNGSRRKVKAKSKKDSMKSIMKSFRSIDIFGVPISLNFKGKSSHQTYLGACCSLLFSPSFLGIFIYSTIFFNYNSNDVIRTSSTLSPLDKPTDGIALMAEDGSSRFYFELFFNDA